MYDTYVEFVLIRLFGYQEPQGLPSWQGGAWIPPHLGGCYGARVLVAKLPFFVRGM